MPKVDSILQQLHEGSDIKKVRAAIADLIEQHLQAVKDSLGYWEKTHFANAVAALAWNTNSLHQPTDAWLLLCVANIEKALVPPNQRDEDYTPREKELEAITYKELIEAINSLRKVGC